MRRVLPIAGCLLSLSLAVPAAAQSDPPTPSRGAGLGLDPTATQVGDLILPAGGPTGKPETTVAPGAKSLQFHGYLRVPLRIGLGSGDDVAAGVVGGVKLHVPPHVPDSAYTDWQYTNGMGGPWTELRLSY